MQEILLTDLIDVNVLQRIQNGFSKFTGMASLTTDANGNPITEGSCFTDFCTKYTRSTECGLNRCMDCDKKAGIQALEQGRSVVYNCHAGLVDYAAPIMVEGRYLGTFLGGQVRTAPVSEEHVRHTARELGLDEEEYLQAAYRTKQYDHEQVERAAEFLAEVAAVLSEMAYKSFVALQQSRRLERAARSHNDFIVEMNSAMSQRVQEWLEMAQEMQDEKDPDKSALLMDALMQKGQAFMETLDETVEYFKVASGEIELREKEYNIRDLIKGVRRSSKSEAQEKGNEIKLEFAEDLPEVLLGDAGRIRQIVTRFVSSCNRSTKDGVITIRVYADRMSYATQTIIEIADTGKGMNAEELRVMKDVFANWSAQTDSVGSTVIPMLLAKMSGTVEVDSVQGEGTVYRISIPQLAM